MLSNKNIESGIEEGVKRLFIRITRETLPRIADKYPFLYLERGRLEVDDSSVRWIDCSKNCVRIPVATIACLLLGPGTTVTHEAIKTASAANCMLCWTGEDSLLFYAAGFSPTADTRNLQRQAMLSVVPEYSLAVAKKMFLRRFPGENLDDKDLHTLMGMEGIRVRDFYLQKAEEYGVGWKGRSYVPGKFELSDTVNRILTSCNAALYAILTSIIHSMGYSPHLGFIHSGSPLPFVYDLADLYKSELCVDLAFYLTKKMAGKYNRYTVSEAFRKRVIEKDIMKQVTLDIEELLGERSARRYCK